MEEERWCGWDKNGKEAVREDGAWKVLWRNRRRAPKWCSGICLLLWLPRCCMNRFYPSMLGLSTGLLSTPENLGEPGYSRFSCVFWPLNCFLYRVFWFFLRPFLWNFWPFTTLFVIIHCTPICLLFPGGRFSAWNGYSQV
jgi:hypothetical protein